MTDTITKFLFRRRTAMLPLAAIAMICCADPHLSGFLIGLGLVSVGETIRLWSAGHLIKTDKLTTTGPFGWVRNPLYIGSFVIAGGYCAMTGGWVVWAIVLPMFLATHCSAVKWEEDGLLARYGESFARYCRLVPRWIPRPPASEIRSSTRFSVNRVRLNKELRTVLGTLLVIILFAVKLYY